MKILNYIRKDLKIGIIGAVLLAAVVLFGVGFIAYKLLSHDENVSPEAVPVQEAADELKDYTFKQHDNLTFACKPDNIVIGEVYDKVDVTILTNGITISDEEYKKDACELFDLLKSSDTPDSSKVEYDAESDDYCYSDDDMLFDYFNTGSTLWVDYREMSDDGREYDPGYSDVVKRIKADDIDPDESYNVGGESYSLNDAKSFTDKKIEELSKYIHVYSPVLSDIAVIYIPEKDEYCYLLRYSTTIDGVPTNDSGLIDSDEKESLRGNYLNVEIRHKDKISVLDNFANFHIDRRGAVTDIIPLSQAEDIAAEVLAPKSEYICTDCRLKYVCMIKGSDSAKSTAVYKPMWVFTLEEEQTKEYDFRGDNFGKNNLYIDAVTGDVFIYQFIPNAVIRQDDVRYGGLFA
ncbi:MAG: hypothetical protein IKR76_03295 [Ruminococcus sp.]|nr:hypothetical protein [Ruminococcus sp.]